MLNVKNEDFINKITEDRKTAKSTSNSYKVSINLYSEVNLMSMEELIAEAKFEEKERIAWVDRKLKKRLVNFREYVFDNYKKSTANTYLRIIKTVYRNFEIEVHPLPYFNTNFADTNPPIEYEDLPKKEDIQRAIELSDLFMTDFILFCESTGSARKEARNITLKGFFKSTNGFHEFNKHHDIERAIKEILNAGDIIPVWYLRRQKTKKYYYTLQSPESVTAMCYDLLSRNEELTLDMKILDIDNSYLTRKFEKLNKKLEMGSHGSFVRFRPHMLRKYHASQLKQSPFMDMDMIDSLQGRRKTQVRESYYFDNPNELRAAYEKSLKYILINSEVRTIKDPDFVKLEKERDELIEKNKKIQEENKEFILDVLRERNLL